jgi:hypothetical protein
MEFYKNEKYHRVKTGDTVEYATFGGGIRVVKVTDVLEDVKNGYPGFDGVVLGERSASDVYFGTVNEKVWGYADQILKVNGEEV